MHVGHERIWSLNVDAQDSVASNDDIKPDTLCYVSHKVEDDPQLRRWGHQREAIKQYLTEHADGV